MSAYGPAKAEEEGRDTLISTLIIKSSHGRGFICATLDDILWNAARRRLSVSATEIDGQMILPDPGNTEQTDSNEQHTKR